jgi:hypothetical protein
MSLDGAPLPGNLIPLDRHGSEHEVQVVLG